MIDGRSDASQRLFVHVAVSALSDLTTPDRFVRVVPPPFAHLLPPPRPAAFPLPPGAVIGPELTNLEAAIRSRAPFSEISPLLSAVRSLLGASSEAPVFAAALLVATQDSPRHVLDWTDHYDAHFRTLIGASPDASRAAAAAAIAAGAQKSSLMRVVLPKWVERGYVSPSAAVEALLDHVAEGKVPWFERFSCVDVEAVVADCVRPVVSRMGKCGKGEEYEKAKKEFVQVCCKTVTVRNKWYFVILVCILCGIFDTFLIHNLFFIVSFDYFLSLFDHFLMFFQVTFLSFSIFADTSLRVF